MTTSSLSKPFFGKISSASDFLNNAEVGVVDDNRTGRFQVLDGFVKSIV